MKNNLIEKFIQETGLELLKKIYITGYNVVITDNTNDSMLISQPFFTENTIVVSFNDVEKTYFYKKCIDNNFHWTIVSEKKI